MVNQRQQRIHQEKRKQRAGRLAVLLVAVCLLLVISHGLFRMVKDGITRSLLAYEPAVNGEVVAGIKVKGVIIRPETTILAPVDGRFENVVLNEARVKKGTVIGYIYPAQGGPPHPVRAPRAGMVVLGIDELEPAFKALQFMACTPQIFDYKGHFRLMTGVEVNAGQPFIKIVDNLVPLQIIIGFDLADFDEPWNSGKKVYLGWRDKLYRVEVTALKGIGSTGMALLTLPADDQLGKFRTATFTVIKNRAEGLTVPVTSLVHYGTGFGVYILQNGEPELKPVTIICRNQKRAVVEGINGGDLVLTNPKYIDGAKPIIER